MKWKIIQGDTDGDLLEIVEFPTWDKAYEYALETYDPHSKEILDLGGELPYNPNFEIIVREA